MEGKLPQEERKAGFIPKLIIGFKALKNKIVRLVVEMFTLGISTRKVKGVTKLLIGKGVSRSEVSRLNGTIKSGI